MFSKFRIQDREGGQLTLADHQSIWTKFCFLDESGSLSNPNDPFFTVGFLKCSQPYYLQSKLLYERTVRHFHDELKFNLLSKRNIEFAKFALDAFFAVRSLTFSSYSVDKQGEYFKKKFDGDVWQAYERISLRVLEAAIPKNEILIVIADYMTAPKNIRFEVNVKRKINEKMQRLAIAGVCRFNSKSNDLLQLADLIVGAINYDIKLTVGAVRGDKYKIEFLNHLKACSGTDTFFQGFRNYVFNIFVDKDATQRLPLKPSEHNEKGPSS